MASKKKEDLKKIKSSNGIDAKLLTVNDLTAKLFLTEKMESKWKIGLMLVLGMNVVLLIGLLVLYKEGYVKFSSKKFKL